MATGYFFNCIFSPDQPSVPIPGPTAQALPDPLHPNWCVRGVLYLVVLLHVRFQVSFEACGMILSCIKIIFTYLQLVSDQHPMPVTLTTVLSRMGISDGFRVYPICYECHHIFVLASGATIPKTCPDCETVVLRSRDRSSAAASNLSDSDTDADDDQPTSTAGSPGPHMVFPMQSLSDSLQEMFQRPGMLDAVNAWKTRPLATHNKLRCMQDAAVWKQVKGPDGQSFFFGPSSKDELRIGVTFSLDWYDHSLNLNNITVLIREE